MNIVIYSLLSVNAKDILKRSKQHWMPLMFTVWRTFKKKKKIFFKISGVGLAYYIYKLHCCVITFLTFFFLFVLDRMCLLLSEIVRPVVQ